MYGTSRGWIHIDRAIEKIASEYVQGLAGPPTDLVKLSYRLGIVDIRLDDTMVVPGELRKLSDGLVVFLLPNLTRTRRRFTLAHELGHAVFEWSGRRPQPSVELERLCDKFAAEFLMPRKLFAKHAGWRPGLGQIRDLCNTFDTGLFSTLRRAADLYGYRAFELDGDEVGWRCRVSRVFVSQVSRLVFEGRGDSGSEVVELFERGEYSRWELQWSVLGGMDHRIALLRPAGVSVQRKVSGQCEVSLSGRR